MKISSQPANNFGYCITETGIPVPLRALCASVVDREVVERATWNRRRRALQSLYVISNQLSVISQEFVGGLLQASGFGGRSDLRFLTQVATVPHRT